MVFQCSNGFSTMKNQLTEKECFKNGLHNFNSIESLKKYLDRIKPFLLGYHSIILSTAKSREKKGEDLTSILIHAENTISRIVNN